MTENIDRERIAELVANGQTIRAIQEVMEKTGLSLSKARELVNSVATKSDC